MPNADSPKPSARRQTEGTGLPIILIARTLSNVGLRLNTFFLPAIARGLSVPLSAAGAFVSVANLMGLVSPVFGAVSDRSGGRRVMVFGTALFALAALMVAGLPWYGTAVVAFGLMGLSKMAFDPALQVFIGQRVPYERRGRALGLAELAWALSLLGMPLCGWLIDVVNWRAPFLVLGLAGLPVWWLTSQALPEDLTEARGVRSSETRIRGIATALLDRLRDVGQDPQSLLALTTMALIGFAQINVLVVYGAWMEDRFGLTVSGLGLVTLVIGAAELLAELAVAFLADPLGKRRSILVSVTFTALAYLVLPHLTRSLSVALVGTAVMTFFFEFTIVALIPLVSGMTADARGTVMSLGRAAGAASRAIAALVGVGLYQAGDIGRNGPVSALACLLLLLVLARLRERGE